MTVRVAFRAVAAWADFEQDPLWVWIYRAFVLPGEASLVVYSL